MTRIHSVAGLVSPERPLVARPPFRAPHHSSSTAAIVGGGSGPRPGEATLAHRGVLLLDEFPEFQRPALEALRQPLEDGVVAIARAAGAAIFPARFQLVATMNLCPCGARGDPAAECSCSPQRLAAFRDKLSRALLDRFDLVVTVPRPRAVELASVGRRAARSPSALGSSRHARGRPRRGLPRRTSCSRARSTGCRSRRAAVRASPVSRARSQRSQEPTPSRRSTSPRRSRTGRRGSSSDDRRPRPRASSLPAAAARDLRPAAEALRARSGRGRRSRAADRRGRRRALLLALRRPRRAPPRPRARRCRARRRQRPRPRDRRRNPSRRARSGRRHRCGPRLRDRPRLSRCALRARAADPRDRAGRLRVRAGRRAGTVALPCPQPDHRRAQRRDRRRRGARAQRRAHHRRSGAGGGPRRVRGSGRDHERALGGNERAAQARRRAVHRCRRRARVVRPRARRNARGPG